MNGQEEPVSFAVVRGTRYATPPRFSRVWAMPSGETFLIKPIADLLRRYVGDGRGWIDPFAGNNSPAEFTNDLNPATRAKEHMLAKDFVRKDWGGRKFKGAIFDPPYSGRQVAELYTAIGKMVHTDDTNSYFYYEVIDALAPLVEAGGYAISCGWNSAGFGLKYGFEIVEIMLVAHGGHHNDTIVTVEQKVNGMLA